ncbi:MAG: hypothetical protein HGB30_05465 [Holophagaceae bacterium]|nr:hypothetical protein [Holophagaceae bacterium]
MTLPDYHFISAPLWLVTALHLLTLTLHLAAMSCLLGGTLIALWTGARKAWPAPDAAGFARVLPAATAATVSLGVAPLLFLQLVYPRQVYAATIVSGWFWLAVIGAVITAYYAFYRTSFQAHRTGRVSLGLLALAALGLLYTSLVYSSVFALAEQPALLRALYAKDQSGWVWNPAAGAYGLRWLHMVLGALTVGGFFVSVLGRKSPAMAATGRAAFVGGMAAAAAVGFLYLISLDADLGAYMRTPAMPVLVVSLALSLAALHFHAKKHFGLSGLCLFLSVFGMVYMRHVLRLVRLQGSFDLAAWRVAPQWSPFLLFLVCFLLMLGVLVWMAKLFFRPDEDVTEA